MRVFARFVEDSGWLWARLHTEKQAARALRKNSGVTIMSGAATLHMHQTQMMAWLPGHLAKLEHAGANTKGRAGPYAKIGEYSWKGGARHRASSAHQAAAMAFTPP